MFFNFITVTIIEKEKDLNQIVVIFPAY